MLKVLPDLGRANATAMKLRIIASALRTVWSALFLLALSRAITPNINEQNEMNTTIITLFLVIIYKLTTKYCKLLTINLFCDK